MINRKVIIAVDFDGTLCGYHTPGSPMGGAIPNSIEYCKLLREKHDCSLILWTCRTGYNLVEAVLWSQQLGLTFDAVNHNLILSPEFGTPKIIADYYIDDKSASRTNGDNLTGEEWTTIYNRIVKEVTEGTV